MDPDEFEALQSSEQAPSSPDYVPSIWKEDPEEDLTDEGDDDDEEESSEDDDKEEEKASKEDEDEKEEYLALADSTILPVTDPFPSAEETEPFETNKSAATPPPPKSPRITADRRSDIPETNMPYQKRLCLTTIASWFEVWESSTATATRQTGHTLARRVDYGFIDTLDASIRSSESRVMTTVEDVNETVIDLDIAQGHDAHELYAWSRSEDRSMALEALIRAHKVCITTLEAQTKALQRDVSVLQRQRIEDRDRLTIHIQYEHDRFRELAHTRDAERQDGLADAGSSFVYFTKMAPKRTTTPMSDVAIKALVARSVADALVEHEANESRNGDDSYDSGSGRKRTVPTARECTMFPKASDEVEKYIRGLSDMIQGSVMASKPKTMQEEIKFATDMRDQKIRTFAERQAKNKRKLDDSLKNNHTQQQPHKTQNVTRAYTAGPGEKREYDGSLHLCTKCNYHHNG
nr:hypothetical protein [Tanacetum cinerariifolium]